MDDRLPDLLRRLQSLPPSKWGYHEKYLCQELGMGAKEGVGVRKQLGQLLLFKKAVGAKNERKLGRARAYQ